MSGRLLQELDNALSAGLKITPAKVQMLRVIATRAHHVDDWFACAGEHAKQDPRTVTISSREMCQELGNITNDYRKCVIRDLRDKYGLNVRVPIGKDKNGAPLYAVPGRSPIYRFPTPSEFKAAIQRQKRA